MARRRRGSQQTHQQPHSQDKDIVIANIGLRGSQWAAVAAIVVAIIGCISASFLTPLTSIVMNRLFSTPTISAIPTASPSSAMLYQADFSKGDQGWLKSGHSSQWTFNDKNKVIESDGSLFCCSSTTIKNIVWVAPYTVAKSDYTVEAKIRVIGINRNHSYTESDKDQEPFFGLYIRGDGLNEEGYIAGINGFPVGEPNAGAYTSFLTFGPTIPGGKIFHGKEAGGKDYMLDETWHTYKLDVKGDTFMLSIDNIPVYSSPMQDSYFPSGPNVGIEDYDFYLQIQNFTISSL